MLLTIWVFWFKNPKKIYLFWLGFLSSVNFLSLQMIFPFIGFIFLSVIFYYFKKFIGIKDILLYVVGFLIPLLVVVLYFVYNNALWDLYYWNVLYYLRDYPYAESFGRGFTNILIFFAIFSPVFSFLPFYFLNKLQNKTKDKLRIFTFYEYLFMYGSVISLVLTFWFAIFHPVRFQIGMPLSAIILGIYLNDFWNESKLKIANFMILGLIILLNIWVSAEYIIPKYKQMFNYPQNHNLLTAVYKNDPMYDIIEWIKANSRESDKIIFLADPLFYLETNRLPAHRRATKNLPFLWLPLEGLDGELRSSPPDYWVIDERLVNDRFIEYGYPEVSDFFNKAYCCEPIVFKKDYFTVRKQVSEEGICF